MRGVLLVPLLIAALVQFTHAPPALAGARGDPVDSDFNGDGFSDLVVGAPEENAVHVLYGARSGISAEGDQLWRPSSPGLNWGLDYSSWFGKETASGDFDADGFDDLAIAANSEQAIVLYGSLDGLTALRDQRWSPSNLVEPNPYEDSFGKALATADFNGDGYVDLAIAAPGEDPEDRGQVRILFGSASGLTAAGNQLWSRSTDGVGTGRPGPEGEDLIFGSALAAGNFGRGRPDDLAISSPTEGLVFILYGTKESGLSADRQQRWSSEERGISKLGGELRGSTLAAGDVGGLGAPGLSGWDDLAINGYVGDIEAVFVLYARWDGLSGRGSQAWTQDTFGVNDEAEPEDGFGTALVAGNFDGPESPDDLGIGVPGEGFGGISGVGAVHILYSMSCGGGWERLCAFGEQLWTMDDLSGGGQAFDGFGADLAAGNFGHSRPAAPSDDLVIGVPYRDVDGTVQAGAVGVVYGSYGYGLLPEGSQLWTQNTSGVKERAERYDRFGENV